MSQMDYLRSIPKERNVWKINVLAAAASFACIGIGSYFSQQPLLNAVTAVCTSFSVLGIREILYRFCIMLEEKNHINSRYDGSLRKFFAAFNILGYISMAFPNVFILLIIYWKSKEPLWDGVFCGLSGLTTLLGCLLCSKIINMGQCPVKTSLSIENELGGLDYGSAMAHSFKQGYLNIILPKKGTQDKNLTELMTTYEDIQGVNFAVKKLFILIPLSGYCPTTLENENNPTIEESRPLDEKQQTVAGVKNRSYKNSVYKINTQQGEKIYICAEYATPVKTFHDILVSKYNEKYNRYEKDIILSFYRTLKKILEDDKDCRGLCELIFFDDQYPDQTFRDVSEILLRRINEIKAKTK